MTAGRLVLLAALVFVAFALLAACVVVYVGDPRTLQPQCVVLCDAAAAVVSAEASGVISQKQERDIMSRGPR